jgi:hypothetical protein
MTDRIRKRRTRRALNEVARLREQMRTVNEVVRLREHLKTITGLVSVGADKDAVMAECRAALFPIKKKEPS